MEFGFGDTVVPPFQCVHHAFAFHAASSPVNIAVEDFAENITYAELDQKSTCLSVRLRSLGVGRHSRVCLLVERSVPMVIGILGIIKAGAAYVPLDGNVVSDSTLRHVLQDSSATAILTFRKFASRLEHSAVPAIYLDDFKCECLVTSECKNHFNDLSVAEDSVYVIYTSGEVISW